MAQKWLFKKLDSNQTTKQLSKKIFVTQAPEKFQYQNIEKKERKNISSNKKRERKRERPTLMKKLFAIKTILTRSLYYVVSHSPRHHRK